MGLNVLGLRSELCFFKSNKFLSPSGGVVIVGDDSVVVDVGGDDGVVDSMVDDDVVVISYFVG